MVDLPDKCFKDKVDTDKLTDHMESLIDDTNITKVEVAVHSNESGFGGYEEPPGLIILSSAHPDELNLNEIEDKTGYEVSEVRDHSSERVSTEHHNYSIILEP
jgi:hypothetical protein